MNIYVVLEIGIHISWIYQAHRYLQVSFSRFQNDLDFSAESIRETPSPVTSEEGACWIAGRSLQDEPGRNHYIMIQGIDGNQVVALLRLFYSMRILLAWEFLSRVPVKSPME